MNISTTWGGALATINFSVPEDVKKAFNEAFKGRNKSAVITDLMREAVQRDHLDREGRAAIERILLRRRRAPVMTDERVRAVRHLDRS